jgi:acyl carrier protein
MKKDVFFKKLVDELELEDVEINESSYLHLTSLKTLSLIAFLDEHFGLRVKYIDLKEINSIEKLIALIGKEKFE